LNYTPIVVRVNPSGLYEALKSIAASRAGMHPDRRINTVPHRPQGLVGNPNHPFATILIKTSRHTQQFHGVC